MPSVSEIYKFDELTWPEVNEAVAMGKIPIIPAGSFSSSPRIHVTHSRLAGLF